MVGKQVVVFYEILFKNADCSMKYTNPINIQPFVLGKKISLPYGMAFAKLFQYFEVKLDVETERLTLVEKNILCDETNFRLRGTCAMKKIFLKNNQWVPKSKTKRAIANREVNEEENQPLLKNLTLRPEASTF
ncbi:hypothetical protein D8674_040147 [Pyrus ussuriensis x Pyrus communis]|uniref:Uncharacterized protein n=1 Tax=Pyrus ussuriensis x Pyrus communis TaxID=2448454 RepID=A0A5N5GZF9_9ROSA|nr:hypothetical protein D8674_040147 [Pyrus ussuriensis x Pyrus communis]